MRARNLGLSIIAPLAGAALSAQAQQMPLSVETSAIVRTIFAACPDTEYTQNTNIAGCGLHLHQELSRIGLAFDRAVFGPNPQKPVAINKDMAGAGEAAKEACLKVLGQFNDELDPKGKRTLFTNERIRAFTAGIVMCADALDAGIEKGNKYDLKLGFNFIGIRLALLRNEAFCMAAAAQNAAAEIAQCSHDKKALKTRLELSN